MLASTVELDVYSHYIRVTAENELGRKAMLDYCRSVALYEYVEDPWTGKRNMVMKCVYAEASRDRKSFRVHVHHYEELIRQLKVFGFTDDSIIVNMHPVPVSVPANFNMYTHLIARDYQIPLVEYLGQSGRVKLLTLQTGKGKTFCALRAIANIGKRAILIIPGKYVKKWQEDVAEAYDIPKDRVWTIRGSKALKTTLMLSTVGGVDCDFIICTNKTLYNYIDMYKTFGTAKPEYAVEPEDLFEALGVGVRLIDEVHQDFHLNFRLDLYTNVEKTINLSATLENNSPFMNRMYELMFPLKYQTEMPEYDRYIEVKALHYGLQKPGFLRYKQRGRKSYSQITFEQSIMKHTPSLTSFLKMVDDILLEGYLCKREVGQRCIIFAATVELCTIITKYLQKGHTDYKVTRYTATDEYEVIEQSDIIVSTLKSAGTALDIPGLRTVIMTNATDSKQENIQALGRLRKLKDWPDVAPEFLYLVCQDIAKHLRYHENKIATFRDKAASHKSYFLPYKI